MDLSSPLESRLEIAAFEAAPELTIPPAFDLPVAIASTRPTQILQASKDQIRESLRASTLDGVFATVFSNITGGVLLTNFLMQLGATPGEIGLLASIPMWANFLQPIGAQLADRTHSRHNYCLWIYGIARSLWLFLAVGVFAAEWLEYPRHVLVTLTIAIALVSYFLGALGSAPWLSWMAVLVPRRLRGRYFGIRNSAANLTNLISIPLTGLIVSHWVGGPLQGYGAMLLLGIVFGLISLWFQNFMVDVDPQAQIARTQPVPIDSWQAAIGQLRQNRNFLAFLLYFSLWMFAVNLSGPFFNLYMLDNLKLDVSQASLYTSFTAAANLVMLVFWGKLADRVGNRVILLSVGILVALTPVLWLVTSVNQLSIWLWLPLLHLLSGGTWAAIDLCTNNLQIGVAPQHHQATYFGIAAAAAGVSSALGTMAGGFLAQSLSQGLLGLFVISTVLRFVALLPIAFIQEGRAVETG